MRRLHRQWNQGCVSWEYFRDAGQTCRDGIRKAEAELELKLSRGVKNNKGFCKCVSQKRGRKENLPSWETKQEIWGPLSLYHYSQDLHQHLAFFKIAMNCPSFCCEWPKQATKMVRVPCMSSFRAALWGLQIKMMKFSPWRSCVSCDIVFQWRAIVGVLHWYSCSGRSATGLSAYGYKAQC